MLSLRMYRVSLDREAVERFPALKDRLSKDLRSVISPALSAIASVLSVPASDLRANPSQPRPDYLGTTSAKDGEIFTDGSSLNVVALDTERHTAGARRGSVAYFETPSTTEEPKHSLAVTYIGPTWNSPALDMSLEISNEIMGRPLLASTYGSPRFDELKAEGRESPAPPSAEEEAAVALLSDRPLRAWRYR